MSFKLISILILLVTIFCISIYPVFATERGNTVSKPIQTKQELPIKSSKSSRSSKSSFSSFHLSKNMVQRNAQIVVNTLHPHQLVWVNPLLLKTGYFTPVDQIKSTNPSSSSSHHQSAIQMQKSQNESNKVISEERKKPLSRTYSNKSQSKNFKEYELFPQNKGYTLFHHR